MLLGVLRFKFDMPYNLRVIGISYKLQLTNMGEIFLPTLAAGWLRRWTLELRTLRSRDKAVVNGRRPVSTGTPQR